jgi:heme/copper-type cytochrome/quinol oxidase subunit 4
MVEEHEPTLDQAVLIYLLSMLIFLQACLIFSCHVYDQWAQMLFIAAISLATVVFTLLYSLFPFLRYSNVHYNKWLVGAAWLIMLVWAPAIVCSVLYEVDGHKRRKASKV